MPANRSDDAAATPADGYSVHVVRAYNPGEVLALVPNLLGFNPECSMVVIGTSSPKGTIKTTVRYDLSDPPNGEVAAEQARHALRVLFVDGCDRFLAIGYGPDRLVRQCVDALRAFAYDHGPKARDILRVAEGRYWSYLCQDPACCHVEGTAYDLGSKPEAALLLAAGVPDVLASREALTGLVASVGGIEAETMESTTQRAELRFAQLLRQAGDTGSHLAGHRLIAHTGIHAVAAAIERYQGLPSIDLAEAAWLTIVLRHPWVRDDSEARMDPRRRELHLPFWLDLTRRARPGYVAAPASLLAFVAWQSGNGALANAALERAFADEPEYHMALTLRAALNTGAPPSLAVPPMTPEAVANSYEAEFRAMDAHEQSRESDEPQGM
jgi:hypothetical protein